VEHDEYDGYDEYDEYDEHDEYDEYDELCTMSAARCACTRGSSRAVVLQYLLLQ
jgi:hypothetical protein